MERSMSVEEKIRKAEEIYYRRNADNTRLNTENKIKSKNKKDIKLFKKMIKQIIICLIIYNIFYTIINNDYVFSKDFTEKAKQILSQDINIRELYSTILTTFKSITNQDQVKEKNEVEDIQSNDENIGGAEEIITNTEDNIEVVQEEQESPPITAEETVELSQMEKDVNYIKSTISFIKPIEGTISSMYGLRNPTTSSVPKNHTGTDIAARTGTKIKSATSGTVILASSKGDYGNHLKIQVNDVIIIYAHCNKLYVKEGEVIEQGQEIAEVGSTGNTTGPHLHFEIRYQDRTVNPQMILEL